MQNKVNTSKQIINYSKPYSLNINNKMKAKRVGKKNANTDNTETCYQRENRSTQQKTSPPPSKRYHPLENKLEYTYSKRPSKLSLSHVFEPSKLLLPTDLTKPCLPDHVIQPDCIHQTNDFFQYFPAAPKPLHSRWV